MIFFAPNFQMLQTWVIQTRLNQRFHGSVALLAFISKLISRILAVISKKTGPERCVNCDFTNIFSGQVDFEKSNPEIFCDLKNFDPEIFCDSNFWNLKNFDPTS